MLCRIADASECEAAFNTPRSGAGKTDELRFGARELRASMSQDRLPAVRSPIGMSTATVESVGACSRMSANRSYTWAVISRCRLTPERQTSLPGIHRSLSTRVAPCGLATANVPACPEEWQKNVTHNAMDRRFVRKAHRFRAFFCASRNIMISAACSVCLR